MKPITGRFVLVTTVAFFGTIVAVNAVMMRFAISTMPGVEVDSAYSASLSYAREIAQARQQDKRDWTIDAHVERQHDGSAVVRIDARDQAGQPIAGLNIKCRLARPADRRADIAMTLSEAGGGIYRGIARGVAPGQWDLVIEGRASEQIMFMSRNRVSLAHE